MLKGIIDTKNKEYVLLYLSANKEGYAREIARFYKTSLSPIQNQMDKLEIDGILSSKDVGKTRLYYFNPRYPFSKELNELLEKAIKFLPLSEREKLLMVRKRPRRKNKPL
jgi:hypothetical protein